MNELLNQLSRVLSDVILPNLKSMQTSQAEQIVANDRLEMAIGELQAHIEREFATLQAQLTACRAELAATHALLRMLQDSANDRPTLVH